MHRTYLIAVLLLGVLMLQTARAAENLLPAHLDESAIAQRDLYLVAQDLLARGETGDFAAMREQLLDYPLLPYLDYAWLAPRLSRLPQDAVDRFLDEHADSWVAERLEREWVAELIAQEKWPEVVRYHNPHNTTTILSCKALWARLQTGDDSALDEVPALWDVAISQPNDCDPVFGVWLERGGLTPDIVWSRLGKTLQAGNTSLARYVAGLMPEGEASLARAYLQIHQQPERLRNHEALNARNERVQEIIFHGVRRLADIDAPNAMLMLNTHNDRQGFDDAEMIALQRFIAMRLLLQGFVTETESLLRNTPGLATETLVSWILRDAMRAQDWQRIETWLDRLPEEAQQTERWTYWRARMLAEKGTPGAEAEADALSEADALFRQVAATRSFYGFLSADRLGLDYEMLNRPVPVADEQVLALYEIPAILRAYELYQTGDEAGARNEWAYAWRSMDDEQIISSGRLAESWGWYRNSIQAMIRAGYWDDLQLRFPLAYTDTFALAAQQYTIQPEFLFAVARQESAFMHDVRSPAGARGLMQLMPGTARQTAGRVGLSVSNDDLYDPDINIRLGSHYMAELLEDFAGNRILAAAAYNAGPNRVRQWLRRSADNPLPVDKWIETIPFAETRGYVQNVLAYSVIYAYRQGDRLPLLSDTEADSRF